MKCMTLFSVCTKEWTSVLTVILVMSVSSISMHAQTTQAAPSTADTTSHDNLEYLVGGPLAGLNLPRYPTYHGEPLGRPGRSGNTVQLQLYPGSVENWRAYMGKYMPIRSFFDQQSMVQRWIAPNIPGISESGIKGQYAQPIYNVSRSRVNITQDVEPAVDVITLKAGDTVAQGSTGKLDIGLYCVRIVAAVPQEQLIDFRDDLFIRLAINDKVDGSQSNYRLRVGYCDQFYSLVEFYFHAPVAREYQFKLSIDPASKVDVLVREVIIDDALAGIEQRAIKTKSNQPLLPEQLAAYQKDAPNWGIDGPGRQARLNRDAALWNGFPETNKTWAFFFYRTDQGDMNQRIRPGGMGKDLKALEKEYGKWKLMGPFSEIMLRNEKLDLNYSWADFNAGHPLPAPYPIQDDGNGVAERDSDSQHTGQCFFEVTKASTDRLMAYQHDIGRTAVNLSGKPPRTTFARDNLLKFVRFAYEFPTYDTFNSLDGLITQSGPYNRNFRNRRRDTPAWFLSWYTQYLEYNTLYDQLFPLIQGNEELAQSVSRFIPWVKNSQDLVKLFDSYLVQQTAKKVMRYHYHTHPSGITQLATIMGDAAFTRPWMEWQFSRSWAYPFNLAGVQHYMVSAMDRSGVGRGGTSSYYASGKMAYLYAQDLEAYEAAVGKTPFTLLDRQKYPKVFSALNWPIEMHFAGIQYIRTGDVSGPEKPVGHLIPTQLDISRAAWRWTQDPRHAKILATFDKQTSYTPEAWDAIAAAAATQKRLPYYDQRSRYLPNWAGFLETGQQHDELSFRRGVAVRTGLNHGHAHADSLDLQIAAHGLPLVLDGGQRPGYTAPASSAAGVHNMVTFNGGIGGVDYAWVRNISDNPGVQYMLAQRGEPTGTDRGSRQVAMIDVDEGHKSTATDDQGNQITTIQNTPNSYVMDVFRMEVGTSQHYNFHAMVNDQFEWNAQDVTVPEAGHKFLNINFPDNENNVVGTAPQNFVATWRMQKESNEISTNGHEQNLLQKNYDPNSPYKFLRLHLLDTQGMAAERAQFHTNRPAKNQMTMIRVSNTPEVAKKGTAFIGIIEPYAGDPIITSATSVSVRNNETDAKRAVAVNVKTVNGHDDLLMADGRPNTTREVEGGVLFAGDFAMLSSDRHGLRLASITGGTLLNSPAIRLSVDQRTFDGNVIAVDYPNRKITIDQPWPARNTHQLVEVGHDRKMTAYTLTAIKPQGSQTELTTLRGADFMLSPISRIEIKPKNPPAPAVVTPASADQSAETPSTDIVESAEKTEKPSADKSETASGDNSGDNKEKSEDTAKEDGEDEKNDGDEDVTPEVAQGPVINRIIADLELVPGPAVGRNLGWVVSNGDATKFWRASISSSIYTLDIDTPVDRNDFAPTDEVRLWEYGVGDKVQQRTTASVARVGTNTYRVSATSNMTLSLPGSQIELSKDDGTNWTVAGSASEGWVTVSLTADQTADAPLLLRLK